MLTDAGIKRLKLKDVRYLELDGNGLYLLVCPNGRKVWTVRYWIDKKLHQTSIGDYPFMSLTAARTRRDEIKNTARYEKKPAPTRSAGETFGQFAESWYKARKEPKVSRSTKYLYSLYFKHLKDLWALPLADVTRSDILAVLKGLERNISAETARRCCNVVGMVMRHAVATHKIQYDPSAQLYLDLAVSVSKPMPAATHDAEIRTLIRALSTIDKLILRTMVQVIAYTFVRVGEASLATWAEIDFEKRLWTVPTAHTKSKHGEHLVPLSAQVVELLRVLHTRSGGKGLVFPSPRGRTATTKSALSREMIQLQRLPESDRPIRTVVHGFRATASTVLNEHGWPPDAIEMQLAHYEQNKVRRVYNRAEYLPVRIKMMQWYADYLDSLRDGTPEPEMPV